MCVNGMREGGASDDSGQYVPYIWRKMRLINCERKVDVDIVHEMFNSQASKGCHGPIVAFGPSG